MGYESIALPLSYVGLVGPVRLELTTFGLKIRYASQLRHDPVMVRDRGFEPRTCCS
jgi:hypothetical protein